MSKKGISQKQFNEVIRRLQSESIETVAGKVGIKASTVVSIRQAKTYAEYERRKAVKLQKLSASRAVNPAPRPTPISDIKRHSDNATAPVQSSKSTRRRRTSAKRAVVRPQGQTSEPQISAHLLNEAYEEVIAIKSDLLGKIDGVHDAVDEVKLQLKTVRHQISPLIDEHNAHLHDDVVAAITSNHEARLWWRFWR